jgi:hypothetical protein
MLIMHKRLIGKEKDKERQIHENREKIHKEKLKVIFLIK